MKILIAGLVSVVAHAEPAPELQRVLDRLPQKAACDQLTAPFAKWTDHDAPVAPAPRVEAAMIALERAPGPTAAELALIRAEMTRDFAATFVSYNPVAAGGCAQGRLGLARLVIKAAGQDDKMRRTLAPRLRAVMQRPTFETLLDAMINVIVLENGIDQGLWTAPAGAREEIKALRKELKAESVDFEKTYHAEFEAADVGRQPPTAASVARLNALPNRDHVRGGVLREMTKAADALARERAFAERLR